MAHLPHLHREPSVEEVEQAEQAAQVSSGPGVEFYPGDPLSRGMVDRMRLLNLSLSHMVYLPYEEREESPYQNYMRSSSREKYQVRRCI